MTTTEVAPALTEEAVSQWLVAKFAHKLGVPESEIDIDKVFPDFDLDSTEVLVLSGELEKWLGFELMPTAMWYHPTIGKLAAHIVEASQEED
ncbi:MAG TPA: acyl carrier protein [Arenibaculum sp.]|nr:acyl carrier protein [Arenibaculum sp.]